jgi:sarcosine/dimethylglycine N-methyltransferase
LKPSSATEIRSYESLEKALQAKDDVTTNYNDKGTIIMEMIYGDGFLSPGAAMTTQMLIDLATFSDGSGVLDIGSGLGGAAFYLAEKKACTVQGIDLIEMNVSEANRRAQSRGVDDRVDFVVGDATALPFDDQQFDVVWGQDAWCHVDDKKKLVSEGHRVLVSDGAIVFSDWLLKDANSGLADELRQVTASANLGDVQGYLERLAAQGFELVAHVDTSTDVAARYRDVLVRLSAAEAEVVARFGQRIFDIVLEKQQFVLDAFTTSLLGSGSFVARKIKP